MNQQQRKTVGTVVSWRVDAGQLVLTIELASPVDSVEIMDYDPELSDNRTIFRNGTPLGAKIAPCFDGHRESGTIEISVFNENASFVEGVQAANGPRFWGQVLTVRCE